METISNELSKITISKSITGKVINNLIINGEIDKFMILLNNNNNNNDDNTIFHYKDIYDSNTLLHVAVLNNHECCIKFLLQKGIDINSKNKYGNTALNLACNLGYEKCIESLLLNGADIYIKDSMGCHPINMCIMKDNEKSFELLLKLLNPNGNDNTNDFDINTLLHTAAISGKNKCIPLIYNHFISDIDINSTNNSGNTALIEASVNYGKHYIRYGKDYEEVINTLLDIGTDVNIKNHIGYSAFHYLANHAKDGSNLITLIRRIVNKLDHDRIEWDKIICGLVHTAIHKNYSELVDILFDSFIDRKNDLLIKLADTNNFANNTLLHTAAISGKNKCIHIIFNHFINDIDINSTNNSGNTALIEASINYGKHYIRNGNDYEEVINTLLDIGVDVNIKNHNGYNAFYYLASHAKDGSNLITLIRRIVNKLDHEWDNVIFGELVHTAVYMNYSELISILFDSFIDRYISYQPYKSKIYTLYFPNDNILNTPPIATAELIREKYYFDEIFFYLHMYVANIYANNRSPSNYYAKNSDKTSTLMVVLTDRLKSYLKLTK